MTTDETKSPEPKAHVPVDEQAALLHPPPSPITAEESQDDDSQPTNKSKAEMPASNAMRTRKQKSDRIARLTFQELQPYFTMPLYEAAAKLKICGTVLKRISRRCGIPTWPFRQIRDLNSRIDSLKGLMETAHGRKLDAMTLELSQLEKSRDYILETGQVGDYRSKPAQAKKESSDGGQPRDHLGAPFDRSSDLFRRDMDAVYASHMYPGAPLADAAYFQDLAFRSYDYHRGMQMGSFGESVPPAMRDLSQGYHHRAAMFGMPWYPYMSQQMPGQPLADTRSSYPIVSPPISPQCHVDTRYDPVMMSAEMRHMPGQKRPLEGSFPSAPPSMATGYGSAGSLPYDVMSMHHRSLAAQRSRYHMVEESDSLLGDADERMSKRNKWSSPTTSYPNADWKALVAAVPQTAVESRI